MKIRDARGCGLLQAPHEISKNGGAPNSVAPWADPGKLGGPTPLTPGGRLHVRAQTST